ncbi:MFS transporter [Myroides odoratus]|uniref:Purine efflux pump PbuE n=1 Tax=Myroides odoratus TaxID=256 RepID=A0A378RLH5_MYROD|nr:MFS transporter [Myroides odoratus]QQU05289.1 MFS transporter [Myroides odoratus]STZ27209.1 Purine efflux pump PbuE [Myroides odoratus]
MKKYAIIGAIGLLAIITTEFGIVGILPQIATHYAITIDQAGVLLSGFALIIALAGPVLTLFTAGFNKKTLMLTSIFIFLLTAVVSAFAPPFWLLLVVRLLPAFLQPVFIATALSVSISQAQKEDHNKLMSIVFSGITLAMITTIPLATYMASIFTWTYSFMIQAIVSIIALLLIVFGMPSLPVQAKQTRGSQISILKKPTFILSALMNFFMISAWFSTYSYFTAYLNQAKNMDDTMVSYMLLLFGLVGLFSNFIAGKLLSRSVTKTTLLFLTGTLIVPFLLYFSDTNFWLTVFVLILWAFAYSPSFLNASTYMISTAPDSLEFVNSLATSFGNLGVAMGTTCGGLVIAYFGVEHTIWLTVLFGFLAMVMIYIRQKIEQKTNSCIAPCLQ